MSRDLSTSVSMLQSNSQETKKLIILNEVNLNKNRKEN
jgi:hypothetical protein